jgi:hypothetical protein
VTLDGVGRKISTSTTSDAICGPLTVDRYFDLMNRVHSVSNPHGSGVQVLSTSYLSTTGVTVTSPQGAKGMVGIDFNASANPPSNYNQTYTFVQLLNGVQQKYITSNGQYSVQATPTVGIDKTYPYAYVYPAETWDTPATGLPGSYGEGWETLATL